MTVIVPSLPMCSRASIGVGRLAAAAATATLAAAAARACLSHRRGCRRRDQQSRAQTCTNVRRDRPKS